MYKTIAVIVAAGEGTRLAQKTPKQYNKIAGKTILRRSIEKFLYHPAIDAVIVGINRNHIQLYKNTIANLKVLPYVVGGNTRQETVFNVLQELAYKYSPVKLLIHDAARIFVDNNVIKELVDCLDEHEAAIAALPVTDTVKRADDSMVIKKTISRDNLFLAQTPQAFKFNFIYELHKLYSNINFTDDSALVEHHGKKVGIVSSSLANFKITTKEDLDFARQILEEKVSNSIVKIGSGFDVHKFKKMPDDSKPSTSIMLCGIQIPCEFAIIAHSDGDVALHALTDALLGAVGAGDIGMHFPPTDPKWCGASSDQFVEFAKKIIDEKGGVINNVDITIISQTPKILPYREQCTSRIAEILSLDPADVNIKATTTEHMGFTGRKEGIACHAVVSVTI